MLEVHAILQRQRCNENITKKTGTLSDAYGEVENSTGGENAGHRAAYFQKEAAGERSGTPEEVKKEQRFRNGHVNLF